MKTRDGETPGYVVTQLKDLERDLEYQLKSLKSKQGKIRQRLDLFIEQQETKESQDD